MIVCYLYNVYYKLLFWTHKMHTIRFMIGWAHMEYEKDPTTYSIILCIEKYAWHCNWNSIMIVTWICSGINNHMNREECHISLVLTEWQVLWELLLRNNLPCALLSSFLCNVHYSWKGYRVDVCRYDIVIISEFGVYYSCSA